MSSHCNIIWIDDNPSRATTARDLGAEFLNMEGKDVAPFFATLLTNSPPDLVIVDHILDKTANTTNPVFSKGSTIAEAIKQKWPACPVVGITAANNVAAIDLRTMRVYDALFPFHHFSEFLDRIQGIAKGFSLVARKRVNVDQLIRLLKPPAEERERLMAALADDLKSPNQDASVASRMFRWVEHLMDRPGMLLDDLWSSTLLGLKEAGFAKVLGEFENAKYAGVFARPRVHRWWSCSLTDILFTKCQPESGEFSWHVGRRLPGIKQVHFSSCYYCNEDYPEIVAFLDEVGTERRAMHLKCTVPHPRYKRELFFEDIRMMRGN